MQLIKCYTIRDGKLRHLFRYRADAEAFLRNRKPTGHITVEYAYITNDHDIDCLFPTLLADVERPIPTGVCNVKIVDALLPVIKDSRPPDVVDTVRQRIYWEKKRERWQK